MADIDRRYCEALETRRLLAAVPTQTLVILGSDQPDRISLSMDRRQRGQLVVRLDGQTQRLSTRDIRTILVDGRGGADRVASDRSVKIRVLVADDPIRKRNPTFRRSEIQTLRRTLKLVFGQSDNAVVAVGDADGVLRQAARFGQRLGPFFAPGVSQGLGGGRGGLGSDFFIADFGRTDLTNITGVLGGTTGFTGITTGAGLTGFAGTTPTRTTGFLSDQFAPGVGGTISGGTAGVSAAFSTRDLISGGQAGVSPATGVGTISGGTPGVSPGLGTSTLISGGQAGVGASVGGGGTFDIASGQFGPLNRIVPSGTPASSVGFGQRPIVLPGGSSVVVLTNDSLFDNGFSRI